MKTNLATLMNRAWAMHNETKVSIKRCMEKAWELDRLQKRLMCPRPVTIEYKLKSGKIYRTLATLNMGRGLQQESGREASPKVFTYWDMKRCGIRSFRCENLLNWY